MTADRRIGRRSTRLASVGFLALFIGALVPGVRR